LRRRFKLRFVDDSLDRCATYNAKSARSYADAEVEALQSCVPLFAEKRIRFCFVSTHSHHISGDPLTHQRCLAIVKAAGGQILAEHDVQESFSGDGLIVAYFGNDLIASRAPQLSYNRYSTSLFRNPLFDLYDYMSKNGT
jgi:hypothetical protein